MTPISTSLSRKPLRVDVAAQHVDGRHVALRIARRIVDAHSTVVARWAQRQSPTLTPRRRRPAVSSRSVARTTATRSISTASAGTSVPSTLATSGMRRIDALLVGSTEMRPCPDAASFSGRGSSMRPDTASAPCLRCARPCRAPLASRDRRSAARAACLPVALGASGEHEHGRRGPDRARELGIVRRQRGESLQQAPDPCRRARAARSGDSAVGFRHQDVDADRRGLCSALISRDQLRQHASAATATGRAPRGSSRRSRRSWPASITIARGDSAWYASNHADCSAQSTRGSSPISARERRERSPTPATRMPRRPRAAAAPAPRDRSQRRFPSRRRRR